MKLIKNNPYRTIGILVGATAREKERQIKRLRQFIEAEEEPQDDFSFPILGQLQRTIDNVSYAASKLNLDSDKMNSALFWFYKFNEITDEPAFDSLKDGDLQSAIEIWAKLIATGEVTQRNCSAFQNLSNLILYSAFNNSTINANQLAKGISLKLKFLESDIVKDFKALATDETYKTSKKELQLSFLNHLQSEIDGNKGITSIQFLDIINKQEFSAKEEFLKSFVQKPIEQIEKKIEISKSIRKTNKAEAAKSGKSLYIETFESISQLKTILGTTNIKFSSISDKLSAEILQCGIDYFSHFRDTDTDPSIISLDLFEKAKSLAIGNIARERIQENTNGIQKWNDEKPNREKQKLVEKDLKFITEKLEKFKFSLNTIVNVKEFIYPCKSKLQNIKNTLGPTDDLYLMISNSVVNNALGMLVSVVNEAMKKRTDYVNYLNYKNDLGDLMPGIPGPLANLLRSSGLSIPPANVYTLEELKEVIKEAWTATVFLETYDMPVQQRVAYIKNKEILKGLYKQVNNRIIFYKDTPMPIWLPILGIIIAILLIVQAIWGDNGTSTAFTIMCIIGILFFFNWLKTQVNN